MHNSHHHRKFIYRSIVRTPQVFRLTTTLERVFPPRSSDSRYSPMMTQSYFTLKPPMSSSQKNRNCCRRRSTFTTSKRYRTPGVPRTVSSIPMKSSQRAMRKFLFVSLQSMIVSQSYKRICHSIVHRLRSTMLPSDGWITGTRFHTSRILIPLNTSFKPHVATVSSRATHVTYLHATSVIVISIRYLEHTRVLMRVCAALHLEHCQVRSG